MMKKILLSTITILFFAVGYAQGPLWTRVSADRLESAPKMDRTTFPTSFELYSLNLNALKAQLNTAPSRESGQHSEVVIQFPTPGERLISYRIYEASVMHPDLAARYPDSKSYVGQAIDNPSQTIRFSTTMFGLHAMSFSDDGTNYIDTYTKDLNNYIVYRKSDVVVNRDFQCHVTDEVSNDIIARSTEQAFASDGLFRTYRLAMACTIEYAAFHINAAGLTGGTLAQKKAAVLAAMNVTVTRVNSIYERDMSLTMVLVPNNDLVIFVESDSFNNTNAETLINQSQTVIDANIGSANYDIGHTVSTGGGGLAQLQSPCTSSKARGITGSPSPVGDPFDIDYVAHEMGHQFGGTHTFNNECGGNRSNATAVEPGSGTTIMAYAGICAPDIQSNSDAHFHAVSIAQMSAFVAGAGSCAATVANGNAAPVVEAGPAYIIPNGTPFILKGSATDANGDMLTYSWEQTNNQISVQPPSPTSAFGPNFKSQIPSPSPNRYMPSFSTVLSGDLDSGWEVVPTVARPMNFALTVRDNRSPNGGQTGRDDVTITTASVGPFKLTNPAVQNETWVQGTPESITWDVAGTTANGINAANVNIYFSSDAGATFTPLAMNTPNDGEYTITVPNVAAPYCRIMIEAVENIFFAVSPSFSIGYVVATTTTCNDYTATPNATLSGTPSTGFVGYSVTIPDNVVISDMNVGVNITHPNPNDIRIGVAIPGSNVVNLILYDRNCSNFASPDNVITTFDDEGTSITCSAINAGSNFQPNNALTAFDGMNSQGIWRLAVADATPNVNGVLNSFTFTICSTATTVTLAGDNFEFSDFAVYPNPSEGKFNINFSNATSEEVNVMVHDIRGRSIFANTYQGGGLFSQSIQLNNAEAGIYLLTVTNGERKVVKRIVID